MGFESYDILWNRHTKISLVANNADLPPTVSVNCYPHYTSEKQTAENSIYGSALHIQQGVWTYIRCSSDLTNGYFVVNDNQPQEQTSFPIEVLDTSLTTLSMTSPPNTNVNFGLLFFRELKLWTRYDLWNIYTNCV